MIGMVELIELLNNFLILPMCLYLYQTGGQQRSDKGTSQCSHVPHLPRFVQEEAEKRARPGTRSGTVLNPRKSFSTLECINSARTRKEMVVRSHVPFCGAGKVSGQKPPVSPVKVPLIAEEPSSKFRRLP